MTTWFDDPLTVGEAIRRYGADAVPTIAKQDPQMLVIHGLVETPHGPECIPAVDPHWLAEHTDYRRVTDGAGHSAVMFQCPECGALALHRLDHDPDVKHRHSRRDAA